MILIVIGCAWISGIFLGSRYQIPLAFTITALIPFFLVFLIKKYRKLLILLSLCLVTFFGAGFYYSASFPEHNLADVAINNAEMELKGSIVAPPDIRDNVTHIEFAVKEIKDIVWHKAQDRIIIFVSRYPEYQYGDVLWLKGKLEKPPSFENFDYQSYLVKEGIYFTMLNPKIEVLETGSGPKMFTWINNLRERLSRALSSALPEPQASLAQGIVLGIRSTIPDTLKSNLSITGTAHILAISGINLSIIAGLLVAAGIWVFGRRHYIYVWLALLMIWFYACITGMQAPVIRSAIMASLFLIAELTGRQKNIFVALAFSAAVMVGVNPEILWSVSFQLSFLAMVGIVFIAPPVQSVTRKAIAGTFGEAGFGYQSANLIADSFIITLSSIIAVWPVIAYNFSIVSIIGPLATFLIAPVLLPIIVLGSLAAIAGLIHPLISQVVGWIAWIFLSYMLWLVNALATIPVASIATEAINSILIWTYYTIFSLILLYKSHTKKLLLVISVWVTGIKKCASQSYGLFNQVPKKWIILPLMVPALLTSVAAASMPDDKLHVNIFDVGEGDAILIQIENQNILIDGGPGSQAVCLGLGDKLTFWNRDLDMVILTHPHLDHLSGLIEVVKRYHVKQVIEPNLNFSSSAYTEWINLTESKNINRTFAEAGQRVELRHGAMLEILNPTDSNDVDSEDDLDNLSIVARLSLKKVSFLFSADIQKETEYQLINQRTNLACTIIKVAHHGSVTSSSANFLSASSPQIAVISSGNDNNFGHPNNEILDRLNNTKVFRTDMNGSIEFTTDGENLWVKTQNNLK